MLKTTPFHARTAALCLSHAWRRWAGYIVASSYELSHEREYHAIRSSAALLDISPLYKYAVSGPDAARLLDRVVVQTDRFDRVPIIEPAHVGCASIVTGVAASRARAASTAGSNAASSQPGRWRYAS